MSVWLLYALIAAVIWAVGQILAKKGFSNISPLWNNIFFNLCALIIWIPVVLYLSHNQITIPSPSNMMLIFIAVATYEIFYYAISKGEISLTASLWALYPISTVILASVFLKETLTIIQVAGILLALFGGLLIAWPDKKLPKSILYDKSWIYWGSIGAFLVGAGDFLIKIVSNDIGSYSQIFFIAIAFNILSIVNYLLDKKGRKLPKASVSKYLPTLSAVFITAIGTLFFLLVYQYGPVSLIGPASSIYPGITAILAVIFLKEKISGKQIAGIGSIVIGIILIGI